MCFPFLVKTTNSLPLEKRNQRLARDLLCLFAFKFEKKHHSLIELHFNNLIIAIKPNELPEMNNQTNHAADLGVTMQIIGYLTNVFTHNPPNEQILKKFSKIMKKHNALFEVEQIDGDRSMITIHYNS